MSSTKMTSLRCLGETRGLTQRNLMSAFLLRMLPFFLRIHEESESVDSLAYMHV
ncbi:unnamed protein product [Moneuplotes crassus]|uniref:Uncharacterized protein n=1 Tax=Euplotes crassus TaxID=5936 RepID=A0AAD1XIZ8_EUPCR|nr:unnamed protein product [Moneuplotes crassus]